MKYFLVQERYIPKLPNLDYQINIYQRSRLDYFKGFYKHYFFHWHGGRSKFYIPWGEYEKLIEQVKDIGNHPAKYRRLIALLYRYIDYVPTRIFKRANELLILDLTKLTDSHLARIITKESIELFVKKWYWFHLPPYYYGFEAFLKEVMAESGVPEENVGNWIATLSIPTRLSANSEQEVDFLKLALLQRKRRSKGIFFERALNTHYEQYHYSVSAFGNEPFSLAMLHDRLADHRRQSTRSIHQRIKEIQAIPLRARREKEKILRALGDKAGVRIVSNLLGGLAYLRERNKAWLGRVLYAYGRIYGEVARRVKIPIWETNYYLLRELGEALKKKKIVPVSEIKRRRSCLVVIAEHNVYKKFLSGKRAHQLATKTLRETLHSGDEVRGTCGHGGTARGVVRVIEKPADANKMRRGDIMVAPSTDHELVPAMRKAAAIITDEGGILAHAAVISREFNIPCVIATNNASRVLKDGDRVEVDAARGIVRRI